MDLISTFRYAAKEAKEAKEKKAKEAKEAKEAKQAATENEESAGRSEQSHAPAEGSGEAEDPEDEGAAGS